MNAFLHRVAQRFWEEKQKQVSSLTFVFPNRRAGLFFRKYLAEVAGEPLFAPQVLTINQLFQRLSSLQLADNIDLLLRLYNVYVTDQHSTESFDDFLFWGRMMLSDFNEIDQHLVNAKELFTNLHELKTIEEHFRQLSDDECLSVNTFVKNIQTEDNNVYKEKFFSIWHSLLPIYEHFRESLAAEGLAYMGMLQREVVQRLEIEKLRSLDNRSTYVFIGFNALTSVEKTLMEQLRNADLADFYWDYEAEWLRDPQNRASLFCEQNTRHFPSRYSIAPTTLPTPIIHLIQTPSAIGQAQVINHILQKTPTDDWTKVGIVLPNENMLLPIRQNITDIVQHINITMGQSLHQTPVFALVQALSELALLSKIDATSQTYAFYYKPILSLLHHPYVQAYATEDTHTLQQQIVRGNLVYLTETELAAYPQLAHIIRVSTSPYDTLIFLREIVLLFAQSDSSEAFDKEYLYQTLLILNRLYDLLQQHKHVTLSIKTLYSLLLQLIDNTSIPFEGEPLLGLQVMGVLESRSMDFDTLIVTDVNDEVLPGRVPQNTYIPYDLRLYFGMPTSERQDAIFAYNFYRLLSHTSTVYLLQNTLSNDQTSGEVSRYVYQLQYQYNLPIHKVEVSYIPQVTTLPMPHVEKTPEVIERITTYLTYKGLSPSTLNTYVACPLRFYWQTICQLREPDSISEDIEANQLGSVLHQVMEKLYKHYRPPFEATTDMIELMIQKVNGTDMIENCYCDLFYKKRDHSLLNGRDLLAIHAIRQYARTILQHDKTLCPFTFYAAEDDSLQTEFTTSNGLTIKIKGIIDRIDRAKGYVRVIDYKTGGAHTKQPSFDELFDAKTAIDADHFRQTLFYALLYQANHPNSDCGATIYYTRKQAENIEESFFESYNALQQGECTFEDALRKVLDEILDPNIAFEPRIDNNRCPYCPFTQLCGV